MQVDERQDDTVVRRKGRGFKSTADEEGRTDVIDKQYESLPTTGTTKDTVARSVEGWIIIVTGVHEEATEEDLQDKFGDFGEIKNLHLNLDRRTGYVKGYALIEYELKSQAEAAIRECNNSQLLEQTIQCDFAFVQPPTSIAGAAKKANRTRERSPKPLQTRID